MTARDASALGFTCPRCDYDLRGIAVRDPCPECGTVVSLRERHVSEPRRGASGASLVFGVLGLLGSSGTLGFGLVLGGVAALLGYGSLREVETGVLHPSARGPARAGLMLGFLAVSIDLGAILTRLSSTTGSVGVGSGVLAFMVGGVCVAILLVRSTRQGGDPGGGDGGEA